MIGTIIRWFRRTLPPAWAICLAIFFLLCTEGFYIWMRWYIIVPEVAAEMSENFLRVRDGCATVIMGWYGIFRVMAFHPLFRPNYRAWLEQTPWSSQKPLPLGPIHLLWQDVVLVGLIMLSLHGSTLGRLWPLESFLFTYLVLLGVSFWRTGPWWMGYLIFFGLALAIRTILYPFVTLPLLAAVYVFAAFGLRQALSRFPWPSFQTFDEFARSLRKNNSTRQRPISISVWPLCQPIDVWKVNNVNRHDGILLPLLTAWWMYALTSNISQLNDQLGVLKMLLIGFTFFALIGRVAAYIGPCLPPISLWGRLFTRRWIIPGYDQVLIAPLCIVLFCILGIVIANTIRAEYCVYAYPLTLAVVFLIALNMGPSLRKWRLTGHHRMTLFDNNSKEPNRVKL